MEPLFPSVRRGFAVLAASLAPALILGAALVLRAPAASAQTGQCVNLVAGPNGETIVNQCNTCRVVMLLRPRVGNANPTQRSFNVYPGAPIAVPFKGSGRSRILSDTPCESTSNAPLNPKTAAAPPPESLCVNLYNVNGEVMMLNRCDSCRQVTVARIGQGGGEARASYTLDGKSRMPLEALGAASARLTGEDRCPG